MLWAVSRAPLAQLQAYRRRMGWTFSSASAASGDCNHDFNVWFRVEEQGSGIDDSDRREPAFEPGPGPAGGHAVMRGTDRATYLRERPGLSAFVIEDGGVYHTYSTNARGVDAVWGMHPWLDRAPKGRNETGPWWKRHDASRPG